MLQTAVTMTVSKLFLPRVFVCYTCTIDLCWDISRKTVYYIVRYKPYRLRVNKNHLQLLQNIRLLHDITTVMTLQQQRLLTLNIKLRYRRLITITNTTRIHTLNNALNHLRQLNLQLLHNLIIPNNIYRSMRRHQRYTINFPRTQRTTLNLHNILNPKPLARNINRNSHHPLFQ